VVLICVVGGLVRAQTKKEWEQFRIVATGGRSSSRRAIEAIIMNDAVLAWSEERKESSERCTAPNKISRRKKATVRRDQSCGKVSEVKQICRVS
jgi:hypothetical protein